MIYNREFSKNISNSSASINRGSIFNISGAESISIDAIKKGTKCGRDLRIITANK